MPIPLYIFYGPSGAGKGTQARCLAEALGYTTISTGEILREMQHQPGPHQQAILHSMQTGELAPPDLVNEIVIDYLQAFQGRGLILDGSTRFRSQAEYLEAFLPENYFLPVMVHFLVSEAEVRRRLRERGREDDTPENISRRFAEYNRNRPALVAFYRSLNRYQEFSADDYPDRITKDLLRWIRTYEKRSRHR